MPVETLRPHDSRLPGGPFTPAVSFRLLNKGPDYFRRRAAPGPRLSAVERLEADKAKYVKSQQVALTRQAPVKPPIIRKPLLSPGMMQCRVNTPPARRGPRPGDCEQGGGMGGGRGRRGPPLNLEILNNLINNVCEAPLSSPSPSPSPSSSSSPDTSTSPSSASPSSGAKSIGSSLSAEQERSGRHPASSCTSSPLPSPGQAPPEPPARCPPPVPARGLRPGPPAPYSSPNSVTVRRVDVRPQAEVRKPLRPPLLPKPQPQPQPQHQPQPLIKPRQIAQPQAPPPPPPNSHPPSQAPPPYIPPSPRLPPASPAFTRLSSSSSRGSRLHPSLHRSKSDLSDRYSRATADLQRFFNYCGLDPRDLEGGPEGGPGGRFARAASDIVSVSKMRSVSTPSSEYEERGGEEGGEEGGGASERVPYGISVIERNARVIKWLYGIRQARDSAPPPQDSAPETINSASETRDSASETRDSAPQAKDCTGISNV